MYKQIAYCTCVKKAAYEGMTLWGPTLMKMGSSLKANSTPSLLTLASSIITTTAADTASEMMFPGNPPDVQMILESLML